MNVNKLHIQVFAILMLTQSQVHAATDQKYKFPTGTDSWWVSKGAIHNGQLLYIKRFKSNKSVEGVIEFYKADWKSESEVPGFMESTVNGWRIISKLEEDRQRVVQVRSSQHGSGSEGMMSLMPLEMNNSGRVKRADEFTPLMHGGELISATYSDSPMAAKTQTQIFTGQPRTIATRLKKYLKGRGWSLQDEYSHKDSAIQRFESPKRQLDAALVRIAGFKTMVFINEVAHAPK